MKGISAAKVIIEGQGTGVTGQVGLHALGVFADEFGLGPALSAQIPWTGERAPAHDRGTVLTHAMLMLAGDGHACAHVEALRAQPVLFGPVVLDIDAVSQPAPLDPTTLVGLGGGPGPGCGKPPGC